MKEHIMKSSDFARRYLNMNGRRNRAQAWVENGYDTGELYPLIKETYGHYKKMKDADLPVYYVVQRAIWFYALHDQEALPDRVFYDIYEEKDVALGEFALLCNRIVPWHAELRRDAFYDLIIYEGKVLEGYDIPVPGNFMNPFPGTVPIIDRYSVAINSAANHITTYRENPESFSGTSPHLYLEGDIFLKGKEKYDIDIWENFYEVYPY